MGKRIEIDRDWLYQKYVVEGLTQKQVGQLIGVTATTICKWLKKYEIPAHSGETWKVNKPFKLNTYQRQVIDGALLGDGTLILEKRGINPYFGYLSKSEEHVKYVCDSLKEYARKGDYFKVGNYIRKDTGQPYTQCVFRTQSNPTLLPIYNKWYLNKIKHIPRDLKLTSIVCLIWYLGDGTLCKSSGIIELCTDCFLKEELEEILLPQLASFEAYLKNFRKDCKNYYRICIPYRQVPDFLKYIGDCPVQDYSYKWNYRVPKFTQLNKQPGLEEKIIKQYKDGDTINQIAKNFNRSRQSIKRCLRRYNIIEGE